MLHCCHGEASFSCKSSLNGKFLILDIFNQMHTWYIPSFSQFVQGRRLDVCTEDDTGLLSEVTRIFRETGLSIARAEVDVHDKKAIGTFYLKDTSGNPASREDLERVRPEIGGSTIVDPAVSPGSSPSRTSNNGSRLQKKEEQRPGKFSLGSLLWTHIEKLSSNFSHIKL